MIVHKLWMTQKYNGNGFNGYTQKKFAEFTREGWYLFGFIPLYIRTREVKYS